VLVLPSTARRLIANWEESLPPEARSSAKMCRQDGTTDT
jgi:hypothetical protein